MNFVKLCESIIDELELVEEASHYVLTTIGTDARNAKTKLTQALLNRDLKAAVRAKEELVRQKQKLSRELQPGLYSTRTEPLSEEELDEKIKALSSRYDFLVLTVLNLGKIDQQITEIQEETETPEKVK